ncbi:DUF4238 domain-containing protein [Vibrio vulnificus]|nr:DUF4238 domain-containing protein [Vibrio vulnificus]
MEDKMISKKRQHYVPKRYLKYWLTNRGSNSGSIKAGFWVYPVDKSRKVRFCTDMNSVSQMRYFHKIRIDQDVYDILTFKYKGNELLINQLMRFLPLKIFNDLNCTEKWKHVDISVLEINYLENMYEHLEGQLYSEIDLINADFKKYINDLISGSSDCDITKLIGLFCVQCFRTKKMKDCLSGSIKNVQFYRGEVKVELNEEQLECFLKVVMYIEALRLASDISKREYSIEILLAHRNDHFITSNSPAVILDKGSGNESDMVLDKFVGYIAISPLLALNIHGFQLVKNKTLLTTWLGEGEADLYNQIVRDQADDEIYSSVELV